MFTHLGGNFCVAASDFASLKSTRQENRLWPTVKCLPNFVEVSLKTFIKKDDFVLCGVFIIIVYPLISCMPI